MKKDEEAFAKAYYAWKMRWAPDVEPDPVAFGLSAERGEHIALVIHRSLELERIGIAQKLSKRERK